MDIEPCLPGDRIDVVEHAVVERHEEHQLRERGRAELVDVLDRLEPTNGAVQRQRFLRLWPRHDVMVRPYRFGGWHEPATSVCVLRPLKGLRSTRRMGPGGWQQPMSGARWRALVAACVVL